MSGPNDVTRPRSPLTLSKISPRPATPRDEMARRLYGKTSPSSEHGAALAKALRAGSDPKPPTDAKALAAALKRPSTPLSDDLTRYPGTDEFGILTDPAALYGQTSNEQAKALAAALKRPSTPLSDDLNAFFGTDYLGIPTDPAAAMAQLCAPSTSYQRFKLARDRDRPLEFDGRVVAQVEESSFGGQVLMRAAIYETRGGKFVAEMTRRETNPTVDYGVTKRPYLFAKATVFANLDLAAMSFRTQGGRLTERLLQQIGDVDSEFIE
jgi:hypothetical protein